MVLSPIKNLSGVRNKLYRPTSRTPLRGRLMEPPKKKVETEEPEEEELDDGFELEEWEDEEWDEEDWEEEDWEEDEEEW
jgi:hypothetical protein